MKKDNRILTLKATVSAKEYEAFLADQPRGVEDVKEGFDARLNEVFGAGAEVLTGIKVKAVEVSDELDWDPTHPLAVMGSRPFKPTPKLSKSEKAEKAARKAEKAVKRARKALKKYINGDEDLAELVSNCFEGYPADCMEEATRNLRELGNTLQYIREESPGLAPPLENHIPADIALAIYNTHRTTGLAGMPEEVVKGGIFLEMEHNGGLIIHGTTKMYRLRIEEAGDAISQGQG